MKLTIRPLTPDLWPALEDLFGETGACNGCWCMYWRPKAVSYDCIFQVVQFNLKTPLMDANFSAQGARLAHDAFGPVGNQPGYRLSRSGNNDLLTAGSQVDEASKLCLRLMNIYPGHSGLTLVQPAQA